MRVGLIGCGKEKLSHAAPASKLYTGSFFSATKQWISKPGRVDKWAILSAKYGLLMPDQVVNPYEMSLSISSHETRVEWAEMVFEQLDNQWDSDSTIYMILAGSHYRAAVFHMPMVEDVIGHWTEMRRLSGMRKPQMGIGVIKKYLKEDRSFG